MSMKKIHNIPLANALIDELGGVSKVSRICDINPSSVCDWRKHSVPHYWIKYFKLAFPDLQAWKLEAKEND